MCGYVCTGCGACGEVGSKLLVNSKGIACPECGERNPLQATVCQSCGSQLPELVIPIIPPGVSIKQATKQAV